MGAGRCEERDPERMRQICLKARDRLEAEMRQDHQMVVGKIKSRSPGKRCSDDDWSLWHLPPARQPA